MQFLKTLFWVALAVALVLFASVNWTSVTIALWGGLEADVKLPILVFAAFLIGFLPMLVVHRARMWSQRRRLEHLERQAALLHQPVPAPQDSNPPGPPAPQAQSAADPAPAA